MEKKSCGWVDFTNPLYKDYHDKEWGVPVRSDRKLFEMLILEGAQAGLSWITILNKRNRYKQVFNNFNVRAVANYNESKVNELLKDEGIVRNKRKINSAIQNAKVFLSIQNEFGSFSEYLWGFVDNKPIQNNFKDIDEMPTQTELSQAISKDLKKRGMNFVGPTIIYAYIQAVGLVNNHLVSCPRHKDLS